MSAKCVTYGIGMVDAGAEAEPGTPVGALLDNRGDRALDHVGNIGDRSSSPGMWSRSRSPSRRPCVVPANADAAYRSG